MLELGYIGLTIIMLVMMVIIYYKSVKNSISNPKIQKKRIYQLLGGLGIYLLYLTVLSTTGILLVEGLPPRFIVFLLVPLAIFFGWFYYKNKEDKVLHAMSQTHFVYPQSFRILVEILLLYTFYKGIIPKTATFEGLNYDIIMGISAPFMGYFIFSKKERYTLFKKAWNILGIIMILFVAFIIGTSFYLPQIWGSDQALVEPSFLTLPYLLIAGFLAPLGIFMHVLSLIQLRST